MKANTLNSQEAPTKPPLENLFEFVNKEIKPLPESAFIGLLYTYTSFVCQYESKYPLLKFKKKNEEYTDGLLQVTSREKLSERKDFFIELQSHLRSRLQKIINTTKSKTAEEPRLFIEMKGTRKVFVDTNNDSFLDWFWPGGVKSNGSLDLKKEMALADHIFAEVILDGNLTPSRFRKCEKCGNFFYQPTKRSNYCSDRCASAARQAKYVKKVKGKKKRTQKAGKASQ